MKEALKGKPGRLKRGNEEEVINQRKRKGEKKTDIEFEEPDQKEVKKVNL